MEQQFTKEFIFERIKDSRAPLWSLGLVQGFKNVANVMTYNGIDFTEEDTEDTKIEKSIRQLSNTISTFPDDSEFVIELKASMTTSRNGIYGPFHFFKTERKATDTTAPTPQLGVVPSGFVPVSELKGLEDSLRRNFDMQLETFKRETEQQRREDEFTRRCQQLDERERDLKDKEKEYSSTVAKAADVLIEVGKRLGSMFLMPKGAQMQMAADMQPSPQLGASQPSQNQSDEKADAVEDFADFLYANFTAEDIKTLKQKIINYHQHGEQQQSQMVDEDTANANA